jgi:POT family proton-dependent oligopeptide transporter
MIDTPLAETTRDPRWGDNAFFGHPRGLGYLAFTEAWERFSYYGMTALVVLYMVQQLLLPGHIEHVAGIAGLRRVFELGGPISDQAFASLIFGWYSGLVYFTPVLGGMIADRWLGARKTVVIGALLMSAGHFAMAFDFSFLIALTLLIVGTGCLKGNISAQVGRLYAPDDEAARTRGYTIFSMAINFGAVLGPLGCGLLAQLYGWHAGFALAGGLMLLAMVTYLAGARHLPPERPIRRREAEARAPLTPAERRTCLLLIVVMAITIFQSIAYYQFFDAGILWVSAHADLATPIGSVPVPWFNSIDAFFSIIGVPPLFALWRWQARRGREPNDIAKVGIGAVIATGAALLLALAAALAGAGKVSVALPFIAFAAMGIAFLYYWPTLLALVSQAAPAPVNATLMGTAFLSLFIGNIIMGWIGGYYQPMGPVAFWLLDAAIAGGGALCVLLFGRALARALEPGE